MPKAKTPRAELPTEDEMIREVATLGEYVKRLDASGLDSIPYMGGYISRLSSAQEGMIQEYFRFPERARDVVLFSIHKGWLRRNWEAADLIRWAVTGRIPFLTPVAEAWARSQGLNPVAMPLPPPAPEPAAAPVVTVPAPQPTAAPTGTPGAGSAKPDPLAREVNWQDITLRFLDGNTVSVKTKADDAWKHVPLSDMGLATKRNKATVQCNLLGELIEHQGTLQKRDAFRAGKVVMLEKRVERLNLALRHYFHATNNPIVSKGNKEGYACLFNVEPQSTRYDRNMSATK